jgi:hypothetical protein
VKRFGAWASTTPPPVGAELETRTPARPGSLASDLVLPLGQAVVTGMLVGTLAGFAARRLGFGGNVLELAGGVGLVAAVVAWMILLADHRKLLWGLEVITGLDLDRSGEVGPPGERVVVVNAARARAQAEKVVAEQEGRARRSEFARFVAGIPKTGTDVRAWEEVGLSRDRYREFRDVLIRLGWGRWNSVRQDGRVNERQGWRLVVPVAEILERIGD